MECLTARSVNVSITKKSDIYELKFYISAITMCLSKNKNAFQQLKH